MEWRPGDIAVVAADALSAGPAIRVMQRWSGQVQPAEVGWVHVIVGVDGGEIVEAEGSGAVRRPMHYADRDVHWSTGTLAVTPQQRWDIVHAACLAAQRQVGYSYLDYAAIAAHQWHIPAPGLRAYIASSGHMICSQLADWCCQQGALQLFDDGRWPGYVRPVDIAELLGAPPRPCRWPW